VDELRELIDAMAKRQGQSQIQPQNIHPPVSFVTWLIAAFDRDDAVGDIARDVIRDRADGCMPATLNRFSDVRRHLAEKHRYSEEATPHVHDALYEAFGDWKREMKSRKSLRGW
jgi:hypothetical protein